MLRLFRHHPLYPMRDIIVVNIIVLNKLPQLPSAPAQPRLLQPRHMLPIRCHPSSPAVEPLLLTLINHQEGKTIYIKAIRAFAAPVPRTANVYFQHHHNGPLKRYLVAVPTVHDICSNCFPTDAATPAPNSCQPSCTSRHCTRCNCHGHNGAWCLQTHTTSGVPTPSFSASSIRSDNCSQLLVAYLPRMMIHILAISI